jgi:hypothetical protein
MTVLEPDRAEITETPAAAAPARLGSGRFAGTAVRIEVLDIQRLERLAR